MKNEPETPTVRYRVGTNPLYMCRTVPTGAVAKERAADNKKCGLVVVARAVGVVDATVEVTPRTECAAVAATDSGGREQCPNMDRTLMNSSGDSTTARAEPATNAAIKTLVVNPPVQGMTCDNSE